MKDNIFISILYGIEINAIHSGTIRFLLFFKFALHSAAKSEFYI